MRPRNVHMVFTTRSEEGRGEEEPYLCGAQGAGRAKRETLDFQSAKNSALKLHVRSRVGTQFRCEGGVRAPDQGAGELHPAVPGKGVAGADTTGQAVAQQADVSKDLGRVIGVRCGRARLPGKGKTTIK